MPDGRRDEEKLLDRLPARECGEGVSAPADARGKASAGAARDRRNPGEDSTAHCQWPCIQRENPGGESDRGETRRPRCMETTAPRFPSRRTPLAHPHVEPPHLSSPESSLRPGEHSLPARSSGDKCLMKRPLSGGCGSAHGRHKEPLTKESCNHAALSRSLRFRLRVKVDPRRDDEGTLLARTGPGSLPNRRTQRASQDRLAIARSRPSGTASSDQAATTEPTAGAHEGSGFSLIPVLG
jgi:hypothetical protein